LNAIATIYVGGALWPRDAKPSEMARLTLR